MNRGLEMLGADAQWTLTKEQMIAYTAKKARSDVAIALPIAIHSESLKVAHRDEL